MDRIDAMKVFVTAVDEGSLAGAARRLKRSPTAVSRALTFLEARLGVELLHRTTRTLKLSEAGERYAAACRRVLADLNEADMLASGERSSPRGVLTISAPPVNGEEMLRPIIDGFLDRYPDVSVTILLLDRLVNLVDEGVDIANTDRAFARLLPCCHPPGRRCQARRCGFARIPGKTSPH